MRTHKASPKLLKKLRDRDAKKKDSLTAAQLLSKTREKTKLIDKAIKRESLTQDEKTDYLRIGLGLCGVIVPNQTAELVHRIYEGILDKGNAFSIMDTALIETEVAKKYNLKKLDLIKPKQIKNDTTRPQ